MPASGQCARQKMMMEVEVVVVGQNCARPTTGTAARAPAITAILTGAGADFIVSSVRAGSTSLILSASVPFSAFAAMMVALLSSPKSFPTPSANDLLPLQTGKLAAGH